MKIHGLRAIRTSPAEVSLDSGPGEFSRYLGFPLAQKYRYSCQEGVAFPWDEISSSLGYELLEKRVHLLGFDRLRTLAWKIPWMEEPGRLRSMGSLRVRHDWVTSFSLFTFMHWRRKWQPTPVFLPGESQGQGSLVGCRLWGHTESDTTEGT